MQMLIKRSYVFGLRKCLSVLFMFEIIYYEHGIHICYWKRKHFTYIHYAALYQTIGRYNVSAFDLLRNFRPPTKVLSLLTMLINNFMFVITSNEYWTPETSGPIITVSISPYLRWGGDISSVRWHMVVSGWPTYKRQRQDTGGQSICVGGTRCVLGVAN